GRTLRLDPAWREKVAHNWAITCVIEPSVDVDGLGDVDRLHRKLSMVWGLSLEGSDAVIKGAEHTLSPEHAQMLGDLTHKERKATTARLNQICADTFPARAETYRRWRVGEEYVGLAIPAARISPERRVANPFRSGITFEAFFTVVASLVGDRTVPRTQLVSPWRRKPRRGRNHRRVLRSAVCVPRPEEPAGAVAGGEAVRPTADRLQGGRARDRRDTGPAWGSPR